MKRSGRIRPKSLAQAREWSEWQRRSRPIGRLIRAELDKARIRFESNFKKELMKNLGKTRPKITPQRKKTMARERELREWFWEQVRDFKAKWPEGHDPGICQRCGRNNRLEADHTLGRGPHKWEGWTLQVLCHWCNCYIKRSSKGHDWDFRHAAFKVFLRTAWHRDWELDWHGRWVKKAVV